MTVLAALQWRWSRVGGSRVAHLVPPHPGRLSRTACNRLPLRDALIETPACQLRPVSPLPLRSAIDVDAAQPWRQGPLSAVGRASQKLARERRWAKPGERERMGALIRAAHPANDPERREGWREAVVAGRRGA